MYAEYDEQAVLDGDPIELVCLLYDKAIEKLALARSLTGAERISERNMAIARASEIVLELQGALDGKKGGEIAASLERLYEYIQQQLAAGLAELADEPLAETAQLLETLATGWKDAHQAMRAKPGDEAESQAKLEAAVAGRTWTV